MRGTRDSLMGTERHDVPPPRTRVIEKDGRLIVVEHGRAHAHVPPAPHPRNDMYAGNKSRLPMAGGRSGNSGAVGLEQMQSGAALFLDSAAFGKYLCGKLGARVEDDAGNLYYTPPLVNGKPPGGDPRPRYITPAQQAAFGRSARVLVLLMLAFMAVVIFDEPFDIPNFFWIIGIVIVGFRTLRAMLGVSTASMKNISDTPLAEIRRKKG